MDTQMKLLIAYDGSTSADTALDDLLRAGLPAEAQATVIGVADIFMPGVAGSEGYDPKAAMLSYGSSAVERRLEQVSHALEEARRWATDASERLRRQFPTWKVQTEVCGHSPAWAIVEKADEWKPDLIVLGSHNRSALGRLFLGSVSQTVLTEARCSVRIARGGLAKDPSPVQILIGVDGSSGAALAVTEVASRAWPPDTKAHLVGVLDRAMSTALDWTEEGFQDERAWMGKILATSTAKLQACGLSVAEIVKEGDPKEVLVEEAERLRSDCIFLGARGLRRLQRFLLGSVSTAVATRAPCSVEIVRPRDQEEPTRSGGAKT
ncbi:MAG: Universal stress protein UspA-like nucleotide-binding protein [Deltaproteobacteria bacterium]|nr:Universal stress protein UspA-like nucleotide-binding protein [Deltaproteobacteria bacterium]